MNKNRLEAFSDGVLAIIITIMVLELKAPTSPSLSVLQGLWPVFVSYVQSFLYVGIYWNNHHHLFHAATRVSASLCGPIYTYSFGFLCCRSLPRGWGKRGWR